MNSLQKNEISNNGILVLTKCLSNSKSMKSLNLCNNKGITSKSVSYFKDLLKSTHITELLLTNTKVSSDDFTLYIELNKVKAGQDSFEIELR